MMRKVITRPFRAHSTAWLSGSLCLNMKETLRLEEISEKECGIHKEWSAASFLYEYELYFFKSK